MFPISRPKPPAAQQEPVPAGTGQEGARKPRTHFDIQVQDHVLVQVAEPLQDLPHVGPDLQEKEWRGCPPSERGSAPHWPCAAPFAA